MVFLVVLIHKLKMKYHIKSVARAAYLSKRRICQLEMPIQTPKVSSQQQEFWNLLARRQEHFNFQNVNVSMKPLTPKPKRSDRKKLKKPTKLKQLKLRNWWIKIWICWIIREALKRHSQGELACPRRKDQKGVGIKNLFLSQRYQDSSRRLKSNR